VYHDLIHAIADRLRSIPDIGMVHTYTRYAAESSRLLDLYKVTIDGVEQLRGWYVTLAQRNPLTLTDSHFGGLTERYTIEAVGILGVDDGRESEHTFYTLCETVVRTLTHCPLPLEGVLQAEAQAATWQVNDHRLFGNALCHYAEIALPVEVIREVG